MKNKILITILLIVGLVLLMPSKLPNVASSDSISRSSYLSYEEYLINNDYESLSNKRIDISVLDYLDSESMECEVINNNLKTSGTGSVTWIFDVTETGFYNLELTYMPVTGTSSAIEREILIDGEIPFYGAHQIAFSRMSENANGKIIKKLDKKTKPVLSERSVWVQEYIEDSQKRYANAYKFYLTKGKHELTFKSIREPLLIGGISFNKEEHIDPYSETLEKWQNDYDIYLGTELKFQAEREGGVLNSIRRSDPTLFAISDFSSPKSEPYHPYKVRLNTIGGYNWRVVGDWIEWEIEVEETALYKIGVRSRQNTNRGLYSTREVKINGEFPFEEAKNIKFNFSNDFEYEYLSNDSKSLYFLLEKGINTISMEVTLGDFAEVVSELEDSVIVLNDLYRKIIQITGVSPDKYIDYRLKDKIPSMMQTLNDESTRLNSLMDKLDEITANKGEQSIIIEKKFIKHNVLQEDQEQAINMRVYF